MAVSLREVVSFGRYEPLFRIASGGMAEVYAARIRGEAGFQKLVAVKRMHPHLATDASFVDMFLNEARLAAHIASPHVVQTLDLGRGSDGSLYIVMELVVGLSLAVFEHKGLWPAPVPITLELMAQAAQGLDDAHEATTPAGDELGLIHRDVSPHNILVGIDGRARLSDFGIARAIHAPRRETNVKELKGKFGYMSPEQTRLNPLDHRSDLFSLGVVLWEMLVGQRLFTERDPADCIRNVRKKGVVPPHEIVPEVPPAVSKLVLRALERMPSSRFQTGAAMAEALRRVGRDELGGLPRRKEIAAYVKEVGGEELDRLQRLIRLGTDGAGSEEMEAVRPGSTMVLAADGSGVARVGTTRDTDVSGTSSLPDEPPKIVTVILPEDDEAFENATVTAEVLTSDELFLAQADIEGATANEERALAELTAAHEEDAEDSAETAAYDARHATPAERPGRTGWIALAVVGGALLLGGAAAIAVSMGGEEVPVESLPSARETAPAFGGETEAEGEAEAETASEAEAETEAETEAEAETATETETEADTETEAETEAEAEAETETATETEAETESPSGVSRRRRRRGRRGRRRSGGPELLDVNAFDQQPR